MGVRVKIILAFYFSFFLFTGSYAQDKYSVKHWGSEEQLSQEAISGVLKDGRGFLWIETMGGLFRFDGNHFKLYLKGDKENKSLLDPVMRGVVEDSLHNIWIGSAKGLSRYDTKADTFTHFISKAISDSDNRFIIPFRATYNEIFCIEKLHIITSYNAHSFERKILSDKLETTYPGADKISQTIYDSATNSFILLNGDNLLRFFSSTGKQQHFYLPVPAGAKPGSVEAPGMCYDNTRRVVWIVSHSALFKFSINDNKLEQVNSLNGWIGGVYPGIALDNSQKLWIATVSRGIIIYDPADQSVKTLFANTNSQMAVSENTGIIYTDKDGMIWLGKFSSGLDQLIPVPHITNRFTASPGIPHSLNSVDITAVAKGTDSEVWIGTSAGINIYNPATGGFQLLRKKDMPGISGDNISGLYIDATEKKAWIAVFRGGLYEMDMRKRSCRPVTLKDLSDNIKKIDNFWSISFQPSKGGCVFKVFNEHFEMYAIDNDSAIAHQVYRFSKSLQITKIYNADNHYLFAKNFGSQNDFTYTWQNNHWQITASKMDSIGWTEINYDKTDQTYWVVAGSLIHYNKNFEIIKSYKYKEGEPGYFIFGVIPDHNGNIWFNTQQSVNRLSVKTGKIFTLSEKDGYTKQKYGWGLPLLNDAYGNIYFIGDKGIDVINPQNIQASYPFSRAYFKSLKVNDRQYGLYGDINDLEKLSLAYNENNIAVETGIIDYYSLGASGIRYKLEGINPDWEYVPANSVIHYEKLPPGDYRLIVQASNAAQEYDSPGKVIVIQINPPFWETWWFITLGVIAMLMLFYFIYRLRTANLRKQKANLEQTVTERTSEVILQKKEIEIQRDKVIETLSELKSAQKQLIHQEKMASLGELTAGIAHEIQNPLNFVNNFSEVSNELISEIQEERHKTQGTRDEQMQDEILNDIKQNLEKINHHGKRADAIVKGMLQHSRSSTGAKEPTDINTLCDEYLRLAYHGLRAKDNSFNATMKTDFDDAIGKINIIPQDIGRVLLNLYNNAFYAVAEKKKAQPGYEPIVTVSTKGSLSFGEGWGEVKIIVSDNGSGIPQKALNKIFQPFFTTKPTGQGTGLGLSLSYDIIKAHGGEIKVETKEGKGSEFIIQLPVV